MKKTTVLVLDRDSEPVSRLMDALASELDVEIVARGPDLDTLLDLSSDATVDVALLDCDGIVPPDNAQRNALAYVTGMLPNAKLIVITKRNDPEAVIGAAASGAVGIVSRSASAEELVAAIKLATQDAVVIDRELVTSLGDHLHGTPNGVPSRRPTAPSPLTGRESEVLGMLREGSHVGRIARELKISVHTVRGHVKKILHKLNAHSQLEAVVKAARQGWLPERTNGDS